MDFFKQNNGLGQVVIRGLTEENIQLGITSPIGYFKWPIGDNSSNRGLGICSLTLLYLTQKSPMVD